MTAADGVSILLEVRGERSWRKPLDYAHPLLVQLFNGLMDVAPGLVVELIVKPSPPVAEV